MALQENFFQFETSLFLQIKGTSMGSTFAPSIACLYMWNFEKTFILTEHNPFFENISHWRRYIDDILITWTGDMPQALAFFEWVNTLDPYLRFTHHISDQEIPFLDLLITINDGKLCTKTFSKPTDRNSLLRFDSHHPKSLRQNLPYGQFLRLRRNCSEVEQFSQQAQSLSGKLDLKGYPTRTIRNARKRALNTHRDILLEPSTRQIREAMTCVTTFTPLSNQVQKIILKRWNILSAGTLNIVRPMFSFKRTANLKDILVHTRPQPKRGTMPRHEFLPPVIGHHACGNCNVCHLTETSREIVIGTDDIWRQIKHTNCNTNHCVYLITCPCGLRYVGMTTRAVRIRINEHRSTIRCKRTATKLTNHFLDLHHGPNDMKWTVIEALSQPLPSKRSLLLKEQRWIYRLGSHCHGLNEEIQWTIVT